MLDITGLVLESRYPELQFFVKGPMLTDWRDGFPVQRPKHIIIQFDRYACELDLMAREQEWTDEDKEYVARVIEANLSNPQFVDFWIHQPPKVNPPWPTYDDTHHNQIPVIAQATGMVTEALRYEQLGREGGPRESVVAKLRALEDSQAETGPAVSDDELAAV